MNRNTETISIPFSRPSIGEEEINAVGDVLRSGWLTTGKVASAFEADFAAYVGAPHALAVSSATAGLHLALEATGTGPGDVVIVPSFTFTATAEVVRYLGAEVVFADVSPEGLLMDPADVERRAAEVIRDGRRISAIIVVHLAGEVAPMKAFREIARRYDAALIEDAAHAFPSATAEGYAGTLSDVGVFSFYANKTITTGEGGMVVTSDPEIAGRVKTMRLHGIDREAWDRYLNPAGSWRYQIVAAGYKYNMTDIAAALGRIQLGKADSFLAARRTIAHRYTDGLADLAAAGDLVLPLHSDGHAWHLYIIRLRGKSVDRDAVANSLQEGNIGISVHYIPLHHMRYWSERYPEQIATLPHTDRLAAEILSLPLYPDLTRTQQEYVISRLREAVIRRTPE